MPEAIQTLACQCPSFSAFLAAESSIFVDVCSGTNLACPGRSIEVCLVLDCALEVVGALHSTLVNGVFPVRSLQKIAF